MRIGILGGTFDPIHKGHMDMALCAREQLDLDEIWIMPAGTPPHKSNDAISSRLHRYEMCRIACESMDGCVVKDMELFSLKSKPNYTYLTMERMKQDFPKDEFYFLMGQDSIDYFDQWVEPQRILDCCKIGVFLRGNASDEENYHRVLDKIKILEKNFLGEFIPISIQPTPISSTEIRQLVKVYGDKSKLSPYLDAGVLEYIFEKNLYFDRMEYGLDDIKSMLKSSLKPSRFEHTIGVSDTAAALAMAYGFDSKKAYIAGLLHDCAKYMSNEELLDYCNENGLEVTEGELRAPHLLHAKVGAYMAKSKYHIYDKDILHAVCVHTTGCPNMSLLDKIIFVADYIEPNRDRAKRLDEIRQMAFYNLDFSILMILEDTMDYIKSKNQYLDNSTRETYEYYLKEKHI